jgi:hypothetical protein
MHHLVTCFDFTLYIQSHLIWPSFSYIVDDLVTRDFGGLFFRFGELMLHQSWLHPLSRHSSDDVLSTLTRHPERFH